MIFSETPAFFSFTRSAGVRFAGLFSLCRVRMIKLSESPAFTEAITESTGDGAAGFGATADLGAAGFGAAGEGAAAGFCATRSVARAPIRAKGMSFIDSLRAGIQISNSQQCLG
jgi:hypothetical protein